MLFLIKSDILIKIQLANTSLEDFKKTILLIGMLKEGKKRVKIEMTCF